MCFKVKDAKMLLIAIKDIFNLGGWNLEDIHNMCDQHVLILISAGLKGAIWRNATGAETLKSTHTGTAEFCQKHLG